MGDTRGFALRPFHVFALEVTGTVGQDQVAATLLLHRPRTNHSHSILTPATRSTSSSTRLGACVAVLIGGSSGSCGDSDRPMPDCHRIAGGPRSSLRGPEPGNCGDASPCSSTEATASALKFGGCGPDPHPAQHSVEVYQHSFHALTLPPQCSNVQLPKESNAILYTFTASCPGDPPRPCLMAAAAQRGKRNNHGESRHR